MANEIKPINLSQKALSVSSSTNVKDSFFLYPTISREVESIIASLITHKAHRLLNVTQSFLNIINLLFSRYRVIYENLSKHNIRIQYLL